MPGENQNPVDDNNQNNTPAPASAIKADEDMVTKLVEERVAKELASIKGKLDASYGARDAALNKAAELEAKERARELKQLEEEGKHKEAFEIRLAEEKAAREAAERRNVELTRDLEVRTELGKLPNAVRSERAGALAAEDIKKELVRNDQGVWVHRSGVSVADFIKTFSENPDNAFLFKQKQNSGGGSNPITPGSQQAPTSLFKLSQAEVLKLAAEGKLPQRKR